MRLPKRIALSKSDEGDEENSDLGLFTQDREISPLHYSRHNPVATSNPSVISTDEENE
ncbi:MAG: hypothetical protein Q7R65_03575 [bacterium]|nr:hypothetical protein [bacterium]